MNKTHAKAFGVTLAAVLVGIYIANNDLPVIGSSVRRVLN